MANVAVDAPLIHNPAPSAVASAAIDADDDRGDDAAPGPCFSDHGAGDNNSSTSQPPATATGGPPPVPLEHHSNKFAQQTQQYLCSTAAKNKSGVAPVVAPGGGLQHKGLYSETLGFPYPVNFQAGERIEYCPFFGPPVRLSTRQQKPEGQPKAVRSKPSEAVSKLKQQQREQQQQMQVQQMQMQTPTPMPQPHVQQQQQQHLQTQPPVASFGAAPVAQRQQSTAQPQQQVEQQQPAPSQPAAPVDLTRDPTLIAFGSYLGILSLEKEPHLIPLLQKALAAPIPAPWQQVRDPASGRVYYGNAQTKQTSWDHPLKNDFLAAIQQWRAAYEAAQKKKQQEAEATSPNERSKTEPISSPVAPQRKSDDAAAVDGNKSQPPSAEAVVNPLSGKPVVQQPSGDGDDQEMSDQKQLQEEERSGTASLPGSVPSPGSSAASGVFSASAETQRNDAPAAMDEPRDE